MSETRYRVKNMCHYDIGVTLTNGVNVVIPANGFQMLSADDIAYIESICTVNKFFSKRMLVSYNGKNEEIPLEEVGMYSLENETKHLTDEDITVMLKATPRKLEAMLHEIEDPSELHAIAQVAMKMDLPTSKMRILSDKIPNFDMLEPE